MIYYYRSCSLNPYHNLAIEEYLLNYANKTKDTYIIYLWQNDNTVVIGRNQDAFTECNIEYLTQNNIFLARRKTGGGAVFHDIHNLNFSFITPKSKFEKHKSMTIIKNAIEKFGLEVEISGRNDLLINGAKFSGNAYLNKENAILHHGTILINTNIDILSNVLNVNSNKLKSKGVKSVRNRVINLQQILPKINMQSIENEIKTSFSNTYNDNILNITLQKEEIKKLENEYSSDNWNYGDKKFVQADSFCKQMDFGLCQIKILNSNSDKLIKIYSDSLNTKIIYELQNHINKYKNSTIDEIFKFISTYTKTHK